MKYFVDKWWKTWSVWLLIAADVLASLASFLPEIQQALPVDWYQWAFRAILVARIIKQQTADKPQ